MKNKKRVRHPLAKEVGIGESRWKTIGPPDVNN